MHERSDGDVPSVADRPQRILDGHAHVVEEDFGELGLTRHLEERPHLDAGTVHVDENVGESFVLLRFRIGAGEQSAPVGGPAIAVPDLLAGDDEFVTFNAGVRAHVC